MSADSHTVGAVLLAAGRNERFGSATTGDHRGSTDRRHTARTVLDASLDDRIAAVGHERPLSATRCPDGFDVRYNERYADGQHISVREGIAAAREIEWDAVIFALGDTPIVAPATADTLSGHSKPSREDRSPNRERDSRKSRTLRRNSSRRGACSCR